MAAHEPTMLLLLRLKQLAETQLNTVQLGKYRADAVATNSFMYQPAVRWTIWIVTFHCLFHSFGYYDYNLAVSHCHTPVSMATYIFYFRNLHCCWEANWLLYVYI